MKKTISRIFRMLGHYQLQILLFLVFYFVISPYALVLRWIVRVKFLPSGHWLKVEQQAVTLESLRRSF